MESSADIAKALLSQLQAVRAQHQQFQTRVNVAEQAARARDEEAQKQNTALTKRIGELENELKGARESMEVLRQFTELLPTVKSELDAYEDDVKAFEARRSTRVVHDEAGDTSARVHALEKGVEEIKKQSSLSGIDLSPLGTQSSFSFSEGSRSKGPPSTSKLDARTISIPPTNLEPAPKPAPAPASHVKPVVSSQRTAVPANPTSKSIPAAVINSTGSPQPKSTTTFTFGRESTFAPAAKSFSFGSAQPLFFPFGSPQPQPKTPDTRTNRERLALISKLMEQPLKLGDLWFIIPKPWLDDWNNICYDYPDDSKTEVGQINVMSLTSLFGANAGIEKVSIPAPAWHQLLDWYGSSGEEVPSVVMPRSPGGSPFVDQSPRSIRVFFMLPPSRSQSSIVNGAYTPRLVLPNKCSVRLLTSIVLNSLPQHPEARYIEFFNPTSLFTQGWYTSYQSGLRTIFSESEADKDISTHIGSSVIVFVRVFDEAKGSRVPIDPFPSPASPPRYITWSTSCA